MPQALGERGKEDPMIKQGRYVAAILALILAGCGNSHQQATSEKENEQKSIEQMAGSATPAPQPAVPAQTKPDVLLPTYNVVDRDTYDAPIKTQVELHAVVWGTLTELGLKQLLQKLYDEANATRGFTFHGGKPTHVFIYLYTSLDHFKSGMGQWIAMLSKVGEDANIDTLVKTELISKIDAKPEVKHGLSEAKRKEVFLAIVRADARANAEAEQTYPLEPTRSLTAGQTFTLSKQTPMMPELEPVDPLAAIQRMKQLSAGTRITILRTELKHSTPWYEVGAFSSAGASLGSGWINSVALIGQSTLDPKTQLNKQAEMLGELTKKYKAEVARQCGVAEEQLREISVEGIKKNWPLISVR